LKFGSVENGCRFYEKMLYAHDRLPIHCGWIANDLKVVRRRALEHDVKPIVFFEALGGFEFVGG
jgi:hypothetical protein